MSDLDEGQKKILDGMREDGVLPPEADPNPPKPVEPVKPVEPAKPDEPIEEPPQPRKVEGEEDEDEDGEDGKVEPWRLKKIEKNLSRKLDAGLNSIRELLAKPSTPDNKEKTVEAGEDLAETLKKIEEIATEEGLDAGPLTKVAKAILEGIKISPKIEEGLKKIDVLDKKRNDEEFWAKQNKKYYEEFDTLQTDEEFKDQFGKLNSEELQTVREKLKELAFSKRYASYSLKDLMTLKGNEVIPEKSKTADSGRGGSSSQRRGGPDISGKTILSPEEINGLSSKDFETYSENIAKNKQDTIRRDGQSLT